MTMCVSILQEIKEYADQNLIDCVITMYNVSSILYVVRIYLYINYITNIYLSKKDVSTIIIAIITSRLVKKKLLDVQMIV